MQQGGVAWAACRGTGRGRAGCSDAWERRIDPEVDHKRETTMKTPTVDDEKPKRDNLGPTGPAKISGEKEKSGPADGSYEDDLDHILDRKREKPSG
jgi:hypothetical protein